MLEIPKRKKIDKQDDTRPDNIEQLIEKYGLDQLYDIFKVIIDEVNNNATKEASDIIGLQNEKVDKVEGKSLSTNDYTNEEKTKVSTIPNFEHGLVTCNNMSSVTIAGETCKGYDLTFEKTYTNPPTVLVSTFNNRYSDYGNVGVAVANITATGCKLLFGHNITSSNEGVEYLVISND